MSVYDDLFPKFPDEEFDALIKEERAADLRERQKMREAAGAAVRTMSARRRPLPDTSAIDGPQDSPSKETSGPEY